MRSAEPYEITTNFVMANGLNLGEDFNEFERFDTLKNHLDASGGIISPDDAMALLSEVAIPGRTRWSVVYEPDTLTARIAAGENYEDIF